ncbi:ADP-ribosylglycohydrolase family protein [Amycolatopsis cihanbeyliensis]|uniref:Poly(ADP-ribose) glycohydrolase ARH3 n=1 Tax=Amycolatopsis cihanbeyliensis TaxID=1128664 RepID=A0A542DF80_AMYCI|nr:ADP-ribosylglycohydrolase family protein [Amycolatopsis cihanbeyliensis]TQJ01710.1 poly(ADP-ribose) glycohydrolase ARH3 [Amycolatopsis cihanbeyliensis]
MTAAFAAVTHDKVLGLLLGGALGDALGAPFEGRPSVDAADLAAEERAPSRLVHTDDTALTLALAEHLAQRRDAERLDVDALALEFARAWRAEPWRGYGSGTPHVFGLINAGVPWTEASRATFQGQGSYGNGAAMRVAPVALVADSLHHAAELGQRSGEPTHSHKHGQHGAACQAAAAYLALHSDPAHPLDRTRFLQDLARAVRSRPWHEKFDRATELTRNGAGPKHTAHALGNDASALGSVPTALTAFLTHPDDTTQTIRYAIQTGGDADTIAAMAGALAGARNGASTLSRGLISRLEAADQLHHLADQLAGHPRNPTVTSG